MKRSWPGQSAAVACRGPSLPPGLVCVAVVANRGDRGNFFVPTMSDLIKLFSRNYLTASVQNQHVLDEEAETGERKPNTRVEFIQLSHAF